MYKVYFIFLVCLFWLFILSYVIEIIDTFVDIIDTMRVHTCRIINFIMPIKWYFKMKEHDCEKKRDTHRIKYGDWCKHIKTWSSRDNLSDKEDHQSPQGLHKSLETWRQNDIYKCRERNPVFYFIPGTVLFPGQRGIVFRETGSLSHKR